MLFKNYRAFYPLKWPSVVRVFTSSGPFLYLPSPTVLYLYISLTPGPPLCVSPFLSYIFSSFSHSLSNYTPFLPVSLHLLTFFLLPFSSSVSFSLPTSTSIPPPPSPLQSRTTSSPFFSLCCCCFTIEYFKWVWALRQAGSFHLSSGSILSFWTPRGQAGLGHLDRARVVCKVAKGPCSYVE